MQVNELINLPLFEGVDKAYLVESIASSWHSFDLKAGALLCRQGDIGDSMYLLETGRLEVLINNDIEHVLSLGSRVAVIERGAIIGEVCVFGEKKRSATILALEDSQLLMIEGERFRERIARQEVGALLICYNIARLLSQRLVNANAFIRNLSKKVDRTEVKSELEQYRERFFDDSLLN